MGHILTYTDTDFLTNHRILTEVTFIILPDLENQHGLIEHHSTHFLSSPMPQHGLGRGSWKIYARIDCSALC